MNWTELILAALGSSSFTAVLSAIINRSKQRAEAKKIKSEADDIYVTHIEKRLNLLTERMDLYELRESIEESAINCAHKCRIPDSECPVLQYLESHPIPSKTEYLSRTNSEG